MASNNDAATSNNGGNGITSALASNDDAATNNNGGNVDENTSASTGNSQQNPSAVLQAVQSANAIAGQVRAAFENQDTGSPTFNLSDNLVSTNRGRGARGRGGRGGSRGRGQGRGHGQGQSNIYSFVVILLDHGQTSIPRGSVRLDLERNGRIKPFTISRGAPPVTTYRELVQLFPELGR
ncbi:hypothetical protein OS493_024095 [Desmophyllum pertusum]|uniref:Uncharacterized protein n=1 Tax=Desmophyllum pertusum TaxID=174260 RepID=A0A9W9ZNA5_9CNID|nr:hypothetical protein OS493_024095 [Desmophyllum pertusum]